MFDTQNILRIISAKNEEELVNLLQKENVNASQVISIVRLLGIIRAAVNEALLRTTEQDKDWPFLIDEAMRLLPEFAQRYNVDLNKIPRSLLLGVFLHALIEVGFAIEQILTRAEMNP